MQKTIMSALILGLTASSLAGQAAPPATVGAVMRSAGPTIGDLAPDFTLSGATRYGLLKHPIKLSDFRGSTVVLAFFYQARTKG